MVVLLSLLYLQWWDQKPQALLSPPAICTCSLELFQGQAKPCTASTGASTCASKGFWSLWIALKLFLVFARNTKIQLKRTPEAQKSFILPSNNAQGCVGWINILWNIVWSCCGPVHQGGTGTKSTTVYVIMVTNWTSSSTQPSDFSLSLSLFFFQIFYTFYYIFPHFFGTTTGNS